MSVMERDGSVMLTPEQWARIVAMLPKLKDKKAKKDKTKAKDLNKMGKAELIELVKELL
jgi:hypothetical protein